MKSSIKIASATGKTLPKGGPGGLRRELFELQRVVLSPPELCWTRWALRGRSGGALETSQGRSGVSLSDFGGVLGGGIEMVTFLDGLGVYFSLFFG